MRAVSAGIEESADENQAAEGETEASGRGQGR